MKGLCGEPHFGQAAGVDELKYLKHTKPGRLTAHPLLTAPQPPGEIVPHVLYLVGVPSSNNGTSPHSEIFQVEGGTRIPQKLTPAQHCLSQSHGARSQGRRDLTRTLDRGPPPLRLQTGPQPRSTST